ncbi:hypothetical protein IW139_002147 [Coemansia sp. RSA 353]|nr:hypothetical protein IW142_003566 [Coemansia sp. RSA 564]KAJ2298699.1 hypothetical protein IW139_002147 [Coemansia sp. RSA 353]
MTAPSLADLKRRQQQRRQQQQQKAANLKRKRDTSTPAAPPQQPPKPRGVNSYFAKSSVDPAAKALAQKIRSTASPFAASLRVLKDNPFDIISDEVVNGLHIYSSQESSTIAAAEDSDEGHVVVNANFSDSEDDDAAESDYERELNENDPSLYKLNFVVEQPEMMQIDEEVTLNVPPPANSVPATPVLANPMSANPMPAKSLTFSRPPESLSFRTHISVSSDHPLVLLEPLRDHGSLLSLTSLCNSSSEPINRLADSLMYWEIVSAGQTTEDQFKQAFTSVFRLQTEAPHKYPFIYLNLRDYTVVFKVLAKRANSEGCKRVAVVTRSYLGLRKIMHNEGVEFSLPLAPQVHSWSELPGTATSKGSDSCHLQTTTVDKTWQSAMLVMGIANVNRLFSHLLSTSLQGASMYAPSAFINATMRCSTLRFADVATYTNTAPRERVAKQIYKLDITGVVMPSAWSIILSSLVEIMGDDGFAVAFKETSETVHLNMMVSKQGSAVAGKKGVRFDPKLGFIYS